MNEFVVYSKWLAYELRVKGFKIIRTEVNKNFPQFNVWVFEETEELIAAFEELTNARR